MNQPSEISGTLTSKSGARRTIFDVLGEWLGAYRLFALARRSSIAISATVKTPSRLLLGRKVSIQRGAIVHCGGRRWSSYEGHVHVGDGVVIGPYCILYGAGGIELGDFVHLGPSVKIMSQAGRHDSARLSSNPSFQFAPVRIGAGSWIGAGAVILGGARLGDCVTVAPNSVVSGEVPSNAVVVGNPARIVFMNEEVEP